MHRVPLWAAIGIEVMLLFIVFSEDPDGYIINRGAIWGTIGINFLFILIPVLRHINKISETNDAIQNLQIEHNLKKMIEDNDPEAMFDVAIFNLQNDPTEDDTQTSLALIVQASELGCQRAKEFLEALKNNL